MDSRPLRRRRAVGAILVAASLAACGGGEGGETGATTAAAGGSTGSDARATPPSAAPAELAAPDADAADASIAEAPASPDAAGSGLRDATTAQHSAPADGTGIALLRDVRVGRHDGFERVVFEFAGPSLPGYRMEWTDAAITADGTGAPVRVDGAAKLLMVFDQASGVDLSGAEFEVVYQGPDRIPVAGATEVLTDLVRTGDFEAVLTWVAGTPEVRPFRVQTLRAPSRIVVDVAT